MRITSLEAWNVSMPLLEPYAIAYDTITHANNVFLTLTTNTGLTAWGCAAPDREVTGETADTVLACFHDHIEPLLKGEDPFHYTRLLETLRDQVPAPHSALAMVDIALHDLVARQAQLPLYKLLGAFRTSIPTSVTIGILPIPEALERADAFIRQGFHIIKIKGGVSLEEDIERVHRIREQVGAGVSLRFDANQGYSVQQAIEFANATERCSITIFEQPTKRELMHELGEVTHATPLMVMADESLMNQLDAFHLAKHDWVDMINIKLMKTGGIHEAMLINAVARAARIESMVGCMDESGLSISAGLAFALARSNVLHADLDGHFDLMGDPAAHAVVLRDGVLYPVEGPGLGIEL